MADAKIQSTIEKSEVERLLNANSKNLKSSFIENGDLQKLLKSTADEYKLFRFEAKHWQ